jgi:hypothetical protein
MQILPVVDLTTLMSAMHRPLYTKHLPAKLYLLTGIKEILKAFADAMLVLVLHCDCCAIEQNHPYIMVRCFARTDVLLNAHARVGQTVAWPTDRVVHLYG